MMSCLPLLKAFCFLFCLLYLFDPAWSATAILGLPFTGGSPLCGTSECPSGLYCMSSFQCDTSPTWNNGTAVFPDPLGPGSVMTMITVVVNGLWGCDSNLTGAGNVAIYFAGEHLGDVEVTANNCTCRNCARKVPFNRYVAGWDSYQFGEDNTVQAFGIGGLSTCLSEIDVLITYTPGQPYTTTSLTSSLTSGTASTLTGSSTTSTNGTIPLAQHSLVVVGAVMLSGMVFVNICVVGGWYALKKKPENEDSEAGHGHKTSDNSIPDKQLHFKDIQMGERIGRGSFGEVYSAKWFQTHVAVKKLPVEMLRSNANVVDEFNREINLLRSLRHPNILQFLGSCSIPPNVCLVTEYLPRGDLHKIIHDKTVTLDKRLMKSILIDVSRGMNYLHSSNPVVIHRDLKSHNVLIGEFWNAKVADFGLCKIIQSWEETSKYTPCGTPKWAAPEVLRNEIYTTKADVYSFAIILWEITTRQDPFPGMSAFELIVQVGKHGLRPGEIAESNPLANLITECWDNNPKTRPSFERILTILEAW